MGKNYVEAERDWRGGARREEWMNRVSNGTSLTNFLSASRLQDRKWVMAS